MLDMNLIFDGTLNPTAGVAITATAPSTNVLDMLVGRDIGAGIAYDNELVVTVTTAFTAAGAATLQIFLQASPDNVTYYNLLGTDVIAKADLIVGARLARYAWPVIQKNFPAGDLNPPRYLRLSYVVATGPFTAGALFSNLAPERFELLVYPNNYTVAA